MDHLYMAASQWQSWEAGLPGHGAGTLLFLQMSHRKEESATYPAVSSRLSPIMLSWPLLKARITGIDIEMEDKVELSVLINVLLGWVGWAWKRLCSSCQDLESNDDGSMSTLAVLHADWSVITKFGGVFHLMHINEVYTSVSSSYCWPPT